MSGKTIEEKGLVGLYYAVQRKNAFVYSGQIIAKIDSTHYLVQIAEPLVIKTIDEMTLDNDTRYYFFETIEERDRWSEKRKTDLPKIRRIRS
jgi:hypothetical protein